jgi:hypothetical protein
MDNILRRITERDSEPAVDTPSRVEVAPPVAAVDDAYAGTVEAVLLVFRDAQQLREILSPDTVSALTTEQHRDVLNQLSKALQELWHCEVALQRAVPHD